MLILGPVVHQQEQRGRREALHQAIEQGLRLGINPVEILEHEEQGLHLTFAQQHALQRLQRAAPPLEGVEGQERTVRWQGFEQGEHGRDGVLEGVVQRQDWPVTLARTYGASSRSSM